MCGILGHISNINKSISLDAFKLINDSLSKRGPDADGVKEIFTQNKLIQIGHRRLAIQDLSEKGNQPMESFSGRFIISYNGEIYNHNYLRKLINKYQEIKWKGTSDTETLINLFEIYEFEDVINKLEGMFAFSLFDKKNNFLYLVRDLAGEKPLYVSTSDHSLLFSSDIAALKKFPNFNKNFDKIAIQEYLKYNYIPSPYSIYKNTFKLPESSYLKININKLTLKPFNNFKELINDDNIKYVNWWKPKYNKNYNLNGDYKVVLADVEQALKVSVSQQLISDVPLGAFLSGGIDSSLILSIMQTFQKNTPTFTIGSDDKLLDESINAKNIASYLGSNHTEYKFNNNDYKNLIPEIQSAFSEPFADSSQLPTMLVSKIAKSKVKVVLSGDGGDELFGGYNRYLYANKYWKIINFIPVKYRSFIFNLSSKIPDKLFLQILNLFASKSLHSKIHLSKINKIKNKLKNLNSESNFYYSLITEWDKNSDIFNFDNSDNFDFKNISNIFQNKNIGIEQKMMEADLKTYLPDDILCKVDRSSMNYSLEARSPYLSKKLIDLSFSIPTKYKIKNGITKIILRDILSKYLPKELSNMPKKGFSIPINKLLNNELSDWKNDVLSKSICDSHQLFDYNVIKKLQSDHSNGYSNNEYKLWSIIQFNDWYISNHL